VIAARAVPQREKPVDELVAHDKLQIAHESNVPWILSGAQLENGKVCRRHDWKSDVTKGGTRIRVLLEFGIGDLDC
jgi:hypothetical protein